eukprot:TRINITY_DN27529_c0_g1_i2.p1 TRINITY_DN27529_c0_g1~~TRINITY_DN27529_c0_g1_i2.p1  ORF type:complete len:141 (-),score=33.95 TRINITY_DN27529_c0_g1_i2:151-573(-)
MEATRDEYTDMLIHTAAAEGRVEEVQELLAQGASVNEPNFRGSTPLHCAAEFGNYECVAVLLQAGADVDAVVSSRGNTAAHLAAQGGFAEILRSLLAGGADASARNVWGSTVVKVAKKRQKEGAPGSDEVLAVLAEYGCM